MTSKLKPRYVKALLCSEAPTVGLIPTFHQVKCEICGAPGERRFLMVSVADEAKAGWFCEPAGWWRSSYQPGDDSDYICGACLPHREAAFEGWTPDSPRHGEKFRIRWLSDGKTLGLEGQRSNRWVAWNGELACGFGMAVFADPRHAANFAKLHQLELTSEIPEPFI